MISYGAIALHPLRIWYEKLSGHWLCSMKGDRACLVWAYVLFSVLCVDPHTLSAKRLPLIRLWITYQFPASASASR